jgi:hypothetical protein
LDIAQPLKDLISHCGHLWAAEAEVFETYWDWSGRTSDSDRLWLLRQMYKELYDGVAATLKKLHDGFQSVDTGGGRNEWRNTMEVMRQEFEHYAAFAEVYASLLGETEAFPTSEILLRDGAWPENDVLMAMRASHSRQYGIVGEFARRFTEGGYCTLFSAGMKLENRRGVDRKIAGACRLIFPDEFEHMVSGVFDIARSEATLTGEQWCRLTHLTNEQLRQRVRMRNAQFSNPIPARRLQVILAGACTPLAFDYERAFQIARNPVAPQ